ncbi:MAG: aldehyde dehydrogenase family protein, partial [Acidobacteria bacterium]|nr:aldehyde dehydrogenase family protein [Acidobacteriota bacterium]
MANLAVHRLFIDGEFVNATSGKTIECLNPSTGAPIALVSEATLEDAETAVHSARRAFDEGPWPRMSGRERARILRKIASIIETKCDELARLETLNSGKTIRDATAQVLKSAACFDYYAGLADKIWGQTIPIESSLFAYTVRDPIGVCLGITPWNSPFIMATYKTAPALAAGNTVILKPASATPLTALCLGEICAEAGLPAGVVNVIAGPGATVGMQLAKHPGVDKVALTGSNATGAAIMAAAAMSAKKVTLELGGKSPNIVFADADLNRAVPGSVNAVYSHA